MHANLEYLKSHDGGRRRRSEVRGQIDARDRFRSLKANDMVSYKNAGRISTK